MARYESLNAAQAQLLSWVGEGCPDGIYEGFAHRTVARALSRRGLIAISGSGTNWRATLTNSGSYYLQHGEYPDSELSAPKARTSVETQRLPIGESLLDCSTPPTQIRPKKSGQPGATDSMMAALAAAEGNRFKIDNIEVDHYKRLANIAKRHKKIPAGLQISIESSYRTGIAWVVLEPQPEWMTKILIPVPIPATLRDSTDVVSTIKSRDDLNIRSSEKIRALRLLQAIVAEACKREYAVSAVKQPRKDRWGYIERNDETTGHLEIRIGSDSYRLTIFQETERVEHIATKSELARAGHGYAIPKWGHLPTERLGIRIENKGREFWGSTWTDASEKSLDEKLAQILQELELRHEYAQHQRDEEVRQYLRRKAEWEQARELAIEKHAEAHRAEILIRQIDSWRKASSIREFAEAIEANSNTRSSPEEIRQVREWADWARQYADRIDPLNGKIRTPDPPDPTPTDLAPFMNPWNPYGP